MYQKCKDASLKVCSKITKKKKRNKILQHSCINIHLLFRKEDEWHHERMKKDSDQESQARTLKWREKLFTHQRISSRTACFRWYLQDKDETTWQWWEVMKETRISTQLLDTISHDWEESYSLSHCQRWRTRRVWMQALKWWIIAHAAWCINSWRWCKIEFIIQSCFSLKQCSHLRARSMKARHMWVITTLRRWTQQ